jgi:hypothetical protein
MRAKAGYFLITALFTSLASGQSPAEKILDRQFHFAHAQTRQDLEEIATMIRRIGDFRTASADTTQRVLALQGTASQIALAEWLFRELDKPVNRPPPVTYEYRMSDGGDDVVRVFYMAHTPAIQQLQEVATLVTVITDIRRLYTYNPPRAVVVRGTADQIGLAAWLLNELDKPADRKPSEEPATNEYRLIGGGDDVVRVFYLAHTETVRDFQELFTLIRTITDIRHAFAYNAPRAVAVRATAAQMAFAEWLFRELDKPPDSSKHEYRLAGGGDDVVRIFYLSQSETVQRLEEVFNKVRSATGARRSFMYSVSRVLALRATDEQVALADRLIRERDR